MHTLLVGIFVKSISAIMLAAVSFAMAASSASTSTQPTGPVMMGYDVVEYFNIEAGSDGQKGSSDFQAFLVSTDKTNNTDLMDVRTNA